MGDDMGNDRVVKGLCRKHRIVQLCVRKDKSRTVIRWGCIEDWVS